MTKRQYALARDFSLKLKDLLDNRKDCKTASDIILREITKLDLEYDMRKK